MYAQIAKEDMTVRLVGGANEGLPIAYPAVLCIDIGNRTDVLVGMVYDIEKDEFCKNPSSAQSQPSVEDRLAAAEAAIIAMMEVIR